MKAGERILITGGSGGIGSAIAVACAEREAWPVVGYCRHESRAREVMAQCGGGEICHIDLRASLDQAPAVDAIVHCAASFAPKRSLLDSSEELLTDLLAVNLLGPLRLTKAALRSSRLKRVVFLLSSASFCRGTGPYALSKAAELALCRLLANELSPSGVRVDAIAPGWTATAMAQQAAHAKGQTLDDIARRHAAGMLLDPQQIGDLCATLLFDHPDTPPGNLIVWDRRDGPEPVWQPLNENRLGDEILSGESAMV